jgi:integrase
MPGHIRPRRNKNGTTYQALWRPPGDGRDSERRSKTFRTKKDANHWIAKTEAAAHAGSYVDPRKGEKLFGTVANEWLADKEHDVEPRTHADYASTIRTWLTAPDDPTGARPPFRGQIGRITAGQIEDWLRRIARHRSHRTMAKTYGVFAQIMAFATRRGYLAFNPCVNVKMPRRPRADYDPDTGEYIEQQPPAIVVLTRAEITALADAMPTTAYATALTFDAWMGLRASELWALKLKDIDLLHGGVHVRRAWKEVNNRFYLGPLKSHAGRRYIAMPSFITDLLATYIEDAGISHPESWLFPDEDGEPVRQNRFYKQVFKPAVKAVLPDKSQLRFHDLRHTAASFILAVHPNLFLVMKRLGHASITTTTKTYGHLVGDVDAMLATALDDFNKQPDKGTIVPLPTQQP